MSLRPAEGNDMVVMGDINLDWVVRGHLSFAYSELVTNGVIEWIDLQEAPGGSGLLFANFAHDRGFTPFLLGAVGEDLAGSTIEGWLRDRGIGAGLLKATHQATGTSFIARDRDDIRLLVNSRSNANASLSAEHILHYADIIAACRVLYVSGYCVANRLAPRMQATAKAMELAEQARSTAPKWVVFDVVPHRIYETYSFDEFRSVTQYVDLLISEVATMRRFVGIGTRDEEVTRAVAEETMDGIKGMYPNIILRYGPSGCDFQVTWRRSEGQVVWGATNHAEASDKRGFGDRLVADFLGGILLGKQSPVA